MVFIGNFNLAFQLGPWFGQKMKNSQLIDAISSLLIFVWNKVRCIAKGSRNAVFGTPLTTGCSLMNAESSARYKYSQEGPSEKQKRQKFEGVGVSGGWLMPEPH